MPDLLPIETSEEEKELQELRQYVTRYPKLHKWINLYFDRENLYKADTYLDGTKSAMIAYNIPEDNKQYAWELSSRNTSKCKLWAQRYYALQGMNKEKVLDLIGALAVEGKPKALEILASIMDIYQPKSQQISINTNTQINNNIQITKEEEEQLDLEFAEFIDAKYSKRPDSVSEDIQSPETS